MHIFSAALLAYYSRTFKSAKLLREYRIRKKVELLDELFRSLHNEVRQAPSFLLTEIVKDLKNSDSGSEKKESVLLMISYELYYRSCNAARM